MKHLIQRKRPWSLAARLTVWYAGSAFAIVLMATGILYWALVATLDRQDDQFLADEILILKDVLFEHSEYSGAIQHELEWESAARQYARVSVRIVDHEGHTVAETTGMSETLPVALFPPPVPMNAAYVHGLATRSMDNTPYRLLSGDIGSSPSHGQLTIQIAMDESRKLALCSQYRAVLTVVLALELLLCCAVAYLIATHGTRPVKEITTAARRIRSSTLHERIEVRRFPSDLIVLAETFNEMLDRLEESFGRLSRFSADIAHELRTPLNNIRGESEVTLSKTRSSSEYRDALVSCLEESVALSSVIDNLLLMARAETPVSEMPYEPVNVALELAAMVEFYGVVAGDNGIRLSIETKGDLWTHANRPLLQRAVANVVENAIAHTPRGGEVRVAATDDSNRIYVTVSDTGHGIPAKDVPYVFDRFYRVEHDRSKSSGGSGLGLAIVRSIVGLHGGGIELQSTVGTGTIVTLSLPHARASGVRS